MHNTISRGIKKPKNKLRSPLEKGYSYIHFIKQIKKKDAPSIFYKSSTDQKSFFNKEKKFVVTHRYEKDKGLYLYRVQTVESG